MEAVFLSLLVVVLYLWAVHSVARLAERKGRSYSAFSAIAFFVSPLLAWIIISSVSPDLPAVGDAVQTLQRTSLESGQTLPRKYVSKVLAVDVKLHTAVVQIDVDGRSVWIARSNVRKI